MRHATLLLVIGTLGFAAVAAAAPDPFDPLSLNEQAAEAIRAGDRDTAAILLERAARLAPADRSIGGNLRALRGPGAAPVEGPVGELRREKSS